MLFTFSEAKTILQASAPKIVANDSIEERLFIEGLSKPNPIPHSTECGLIEQDLNKA